MVLWLLVPMSPSPIQPDPLPPGRNKEKKDVPGVFRRLNILEKQNEEASKEVRRAACSRHVDLTHLGSD